MRSESKRRDTGMVTAELAVCLPVLVMLIAVGVSAMSLAGARVRLQDAAREAARAAARGDQAAVQQVAEQVAPGAAVSLSRSGEDVTATARLAVHPLVSWLPAITLDERAVAASEPTSAPP